MNLLKIGKVVPLQNWIFIFMGIPIFLRIAGLYIKSWIFQLKCALNSEKGAVSAKVMEMTNVKKELLYDGMYYDVTNWIKRHPGGNIINVYTSTGEDSTLAVQQFHQRSTKKVMNIMNSLPKRPATEEELKTDSEKSRRHSALTKDFLELYQELQEEGMFKPDILHVFLRLVELFLMIYIGGKLYFLSPQMSIAKIAGFLLVTFGTGRTPWVMHEAGHHSLTGMPKVDRYIKSFLFGFVMGFSGSYWTYEHSRHHAMPQHIKYDADLMTLPVLAFHRKIVKNPEQGKGFILQNQKWLAAPLDAILIALTWKFYIHPRYCLHKRSYFDLFCITVHYVFVFGILGVPLLDYSVGLFLVFIYYFINAIMSHTHLPITEEPTHWVEYALSHTTNVRSSWWVDYWMGYLNYQIEHHLFPTMPQFRNKLCRDRVKALAKKHNLPYNLYSYSETVAKTFENLGAVSKELALQ